MKKRALSFFILGVAVVVSLGVVYIDSVKHYWQFSGGFVRLVVNTNAQAIMTVDTNTLSVGFNTNNIARSFVVQGRQPATNATGTGTSAATSGGVLLVGGVGGSTLETNNATGGAGGIVALVAGLGGMSPFSQTNSTAGAGGALNLNGGAGGGTGSIATNAITGGGGGTISITAGAGGSPNVAATNTVGGLSGNLNLFTSAGGAPSAGWARKGGGGGFITLAAGSGGSGTRTNAGNGGTVSLAAGNAGAAGVSGFPGNGGIMSLLAGNGSTGDTNSDGGYVFIAGGVPGSGAVPGNVVLARTSVGTGLGGVQIGPLVAGSTATLTNLLSVTAVLDFPSIAAGLVADLPVAFAGAADGDAVTLGVPLASVTNCMWMGFASNAVVYVRAANGQLVTAQDPNSGTFRITVEKFR